MTIGNPVREAPRPDPATSWQPVDDWSSLKGQDVVIYVGGKMTDSGQVEDVMADGSLLWLMHNGASSRRIIENLPGTVAIVTTT